MGRTIRECQLGRAPAKFLPAVHIVNDERQVSRNLL
jgi:hypothetical protein